MRIRVALEILRQFSTLNQHCGFEHTGMFTQTHLTNRFPLDSLEKTLWQRRKLVIAKTLTLLSFDILLCLLPESSREIISLVDAENCFFFTASVFRHTSFRFSKLFFTGNDIRTTKSHFLSNTFYSSLLVPFRYASSLCDANLVEPWFVFSRDLPEPK